MVGAMFVVVGVAMVVFARPFARSGVSFYFSDRDLRADSGRGTRRVRMATVFVAVADALAGAFAIYIGLSLLGV